MRLTTLFRATLFQVLALSLLATVNVQAASTYYFSALGNDSTGAGTLASPWKSISKFNSLSLRPGDSALFKAGETFNGKLYLDANDSGVNSSTGALIAPVKIGSYGASGANTRANIVSPYGDLGIQVYNAGGIELSDLNVVSGGINTAARTHGIDFLSSRTATQPPLALKYRRKFNKILFAI